MSSNLRDAGSASSAVDAFLAKKREGQALLDGSARRGRLIFALDATMSRQPTWDTACRLQADMFLEAAAIGGLDVQLVYYRGHSECRASQWVASATRLADMMEKIACRSGETQIGKVLAHAKREAQSTKVHAVVFVGDAMEEGPDELCHAAAELGRLKVPVFMFHEGNIDIAEDVFREIAQLTDGAYCRFDRGAAHQLAALLRGVAAFAAGGIKALTDLSKRDKGAAKLLKQMRT